jgi:hypothetical protein
LYINVNMDGHWYWWTNWWDNPVIWIIYGSYMDPGYGSYVD